MVGVVAVFLLPLLISGQKRRTTLQEHYPGNMSGILAGAVLTDLPPDKVLRTATFTIDRKDIEDHIKKAPSYIRGQLRKYSLFQLAQLTRRHMLLSAAKKQTLKGGPDNDLLVRYIKLIAAKADVTNEKARAFFDNNRDMFGGASFEQVKSNVKRYLLQQEKRLMIDNHVSKLSREFSLEVSSSWVKTAYSRMKDNPLDRARANNRLTVVNFGADGCCGPTMSGTLDEVRKKTSKRVDVLFIDVQREPILVAWYNVRVNPTQIFFDRNGRELYRHTGFISPNGIMNQLKKADLTKENQNDEKNDEQG